MKTKTNIGSKKMKDTIGMKPTELNEELTHRYNTKKYRNQNYNQYRVALKNT